MMANPWIAALVALFVWWFSTGAILWRVKQADNGSPDQHLWSVLLGLPLLIGGVIGLRVTATDPSVTGVYLAFFSALAVWGWIELTFLSGIITGPNRSLCPDDARGTARFWRAFGTVAWHELLLAAALALTAVFAWDAPNAFGLWTFAVLFFARISAKLNLFFGVPQINTEFLTGPLAHLPSHFRRARMNWGFPLSVSALSFAATCWLERLYSVSDPGAIVGFALLTALTLLALLEHWFMVLPLPDERLWRWMIPAPRPKSDTRLHEDANGL